MCLKKNNEYVIMEVPNLNVIDQSFSENTISLNTSYEVHDTYDEFLVEISTKEYLIYGLLGMIY